MAVLFDNAVALTCSSTGDAWVDIDLSTHIPVGGSIAIIEVIVGTTNNTWGLRQKGSTQNLTDFGSANQHAFSYCGLDSNRVIQGAIGSAGAYTLTFKLHGYLTSDEAVFFPTYYDKTPGIAGSWQNIDCSAQIPVDAVYAIFERKGNYTGGPSNLRPTGSTDNRVYYATTGHRDQIVKLDTGRTLDVYQDNINGNLLYLKGYITSGVGKVNGLDMTPTSGSYIDINVASDCGGNVAVIIESYASAAATATYGLRKKGSTDDFYYIAPTENGSSVVGLDASKIFQAKVISGTSLFVTGYIGVLSIPVNINMSPGFSTIPEIIAIQECPINIDTSIGMIATTAMNSGLAGEATLTPFIATGIMVGGLKAEINVQPLIAITDGVAGQSIGWELFIGSMPLVATLEMIGGREANIYCIPFEGTPTMNAGLLTSIHVVPFEFVPEIVALQQSPIDIFTEPFVSYIEARMSIALALLYGYIDSPMSESAMTIIISETININIDTIVNSIVFDSDPIFMIENPVSKINVSMSISNNININIDTITDNQFISMVSEIITIDIDSIIPEIYSFSVMEISMAIGYDSAPLSILATFNINNNFNIKIGTVPNTVYFAGNNGQIINFNIRGAI